VCPDSMILEVTGPESKINSIAEMLQPYGILEMVRTGLVAMVRGSGHFSGMPPERVMDDDDDEDAAPDPAVPGNGYSSETPITTRTLGM